MRILSKHFQPLRQFLRRVEGSLACAVAVTLQSGTLNAAEPLRYNRDIRPILSDNCFACEAVLSPQAIADLIAFMKHH